MWPASKKSSHEHLSLLFTFSPRFVALQIDFFLIIGVHIYEEKPLSCLQSWLNLSPTLGGGIYDRTDLKQRGFLRFEHSEVDHKNIFARNVKSSISWR